jgi:hypothetical protein
VKIKVVVVDLELPAHWKRRLLRLGLPALIVGGAAMAYAAPTHIWANGDALTAEDLNATFNNLDARLSAVEAASPGRSAFAATKKGAQDLPYLTDTVIVFDSELFDLANEYDPVSGVFTPKSGGYYEVGCSWKANITSKGISFYAESGIGIGDSTVIHSAWTGDGAYATRNMRTLVRLEAGTKVTCIGFHDATAMSIPIALDLDSKFEAIRLSP